MNVAELLDAAKRKVGTYAEIAKRLGLAPARVSEWRKGLFKPDASQVAQIAEMAELPVFETVAAIEMSVHPEAESVWRKALEKLKAAGVAACAVLILGMGAGAENANADNGLASLHSGVKNIHRGKCVSRVAMRVMASLASWWSRSRARSA